MSANILFVDDEERILRSMKLIFGKTHNVFLAPGGEEALQILRENDIKVIICDQRMPKMLGVEVLRKAMEISPATMRILLTGYSDVSDIVDSINEAEIFRYIMKPWKNEYIKEIVELAISAAEHTSDVMQKNSKSRNGKAESGEEIVVLPDELATDMLVIDDDTGTQKLISQFFSNQARVFHARTLPEALSVLAENPNISFIVSELFVDNEHATDVLTAIKSQAPHVVIMVLTSYRDTELLFKLINEGQIFRFLLKPASSNLVGISLMRGLEKQQELKNNKKLLVRYSVESTQREAVLAGEGCKEKSSDVPLIIRALSLFGLRRREA